jgi:uncharacterized protein (TIGR03083 family)
MSDATLMWDEVEDIGNLLGELDDADFDAGSLCNGWRVRDVLGHMALGHTTPMAPMTVRIARFRFNVAKASLHGSRAMFEGKDPAEIRRFWTDVMVGQHPMKGISRMIPVRGAFLDHMIHNQDMRRPTGRPRAIPEERLVRALEIARTEGNPFFSPKKNVAGLKLSATDIGWTAGEGPEVSGTGEAILMAAGGRRAALDELKGDGVAQLQARI